MERVAVHAKYIRLNQPDKSGLAEHCLFNKHQPDFESMNVITKTEGFGNKIILEGISIHLEHRAVNRDTGFNLSMCWKLALRLIS